MVLLMHLAQTGKLSVALTAISSFLSRKISAKVFWGNCGSTGLN